MIGKRKKYEKPKMKNHGRLKNITQGGTEGAGDGMGSSEPPHSGLS